MELFGGLPSHFEVIGVELRTWSMNRRRTKLTVIGRYRARIRGTWEVLALPFTHIWYVSGGRVERVVSLLDGVELRRRAPAQSRPHGRRRRSEQPAPLGQAAVLPVPPPGELELGARRPAKYTELRNT